MKTKLILSVFIVTFAMEAWSCSPSPMPTCSKTTTSLDNKKLDPIKTKLEAYFKILTKKHKRPKRATSCYDSFFGGMFIEELSAILKETKGQTCSEQLKQVSTSVIYSVSPDAEMTKTITDKMALQELAKLRSEITELSKKVFLY